MGLSHQDWLDVSNTTSVSATELEWWEYGAGNSSGETRIQVNGDSRRFRYFDSIMLVEQSTIRRDYSQDWPGKQNSIRCDNPKCECTRACEYAILHDIYREYRICYAEMAWAGPIKDTHTRSRTSQVAAGLFSVLVGAGSDEFSPLILFTYPYLHLQPYPQSNLSELRSELSFPPTSARRDGCEEFRPYISISEGR